MIAIGNIELDVGAPDEARLLASTGQSVASMRGLLDQKIMPGLVAAALHACAVVKEDMISIHDLAVRIERAGVDEVRAIVRDLFGDEPAIDAEEWPVSEPQPAADEISAADEEVEEPAPTAPEDEADAEEQ